MNYTPTLSNCTHVIEQDIDWKTSTPNAPATFHEMIGFTDAEIRYREMIVDTALFAAGYDHSRTITMYHADGTKVKSITITSDKSK